MLSALSQWLVGIDVEHGPDGRSSPTFLEAELQRSRGSGSLSSCPPTYPGRPGGARPLPKVISQLALRIITYEHPLEAILAIYFLSVTGHLPDKFPTTSGLRR